MLGEWQTLDNKPELSEDQGPFVQNLTKLLTNVMLKFLSWNMANTSMFFAEKNMSSFCIAKATHIFAAKISMYLKIP